MPGEELTLDYSWDKNILHISEDVPCLCGSEKCRGFLMRAKKSKKEKNAPDKLGSSVASPSKLEEETVIKKMASESIPPPARVVKEVPFSPLSAAIPPKNRIAANLTAIEVANMASCSPASLNSEENFMKLMENEEEPLESESDQNEEDMAQEEEEAEEELEEDEVEDQLEEEVEDNQLEDKLELKMGYELEND